MRIESEYRIDSESAMQALGGAIAARLEAGAVVFLSGDLGAGKTTLVRGLLRALGYQDVVPSPTFTLLEVYEVASRVVLHLDLYRLVEAAELEALAIRDYVGEQSVLLVEWAVRARERLPGPDCEVHITVNEHGQRNVLLESFTAVGERLCTV